MRPMLQARCIGKQYTLGASAARYGTLRDAIAGLFTRRPKAHPRRLWALQDVTFDIMAGEIVGIVGRNGAGKTTLLRVLARITAPTAGEADIWGRVGSLLAVGTGFHPELTGRENVYLSGAILGMTRAEVADDFDAIVAFSEVEQFLDTPVKHYSSGMYVRLAFAVAAHLRTEVLLVDEVLAMGDAAFQARCLRRMGEVAGEGRTVLFVSHNMGAVTHLCRTGIVLDHGRVAFHGPVEEAVLAYNLQLHASNAVDGRSPHVLYEQKREATDRCAIIRIELLDFDGGPKPVVSTWDDVVIRTWYSCAEAVPRGSVVVELSAYDGSKLLLLSTEPDSCVPLPLKIGEHYIDCRIRQLPLSAGEYILSAALAIPNAEWLWRREQLSSLTVSPRDVFSSGMAPLSSRALLVVSHEWAVGP